MRTKSEPFEVTGVVKKHVGHVGSFANVLLDDGNTYTCGMAENLRLPKVGETITITGVINDQGQRLTSSWEPA